MRSPTRRAKRGVAPRHSMSKGGAKRRGRKKKSDKPAWFSRILAFIFFTPEARQYVLAKWAELEEYIMEGLAYTQTYPVDAEYTVVRTVDLWNNDSGMDG